MKLFSTLVILLTAASASAFAPVMTLQARTNVAVRTSNAEELYIDDERRFIMNLLMVGAGLTVVGEFGIPFILFFFPSGATGVRGDIPIPAKDLLGNEIIATEYLSSKLAGDRSLSQGLKGDPTYLIVKEDKTLDSFGLNAICTHMGCIVPWSSANNKFICPCHASQYSPDGTVIRGPAPLPLALAHVDVTGDGKILFSPWTESDFRTGEKAWWND